MNSIHNIFNQEQLTINNVHPPTTYREDKIMEDLKKIFDHIYSPDGINEAISHPVQTFVGKERNNRINELKTQITNERNEYMIELQAKENSYLESSRNVEIYYNNEIEKLKKEHQGEIDKLKDKHQNELNLRDQKNQNGIRLQTETHQKNIDNLNNEIKKLNETIFNDTNREKVYILKCKQQLNTIEELKKNNENDKMNIREELKKINENDKINIRQELKTQYEKTLQEVQQQRVKEVADLTNKLKSNTTELEEIVNKQKVEISQLKEQSTKQLTEIQKGKDIVNQLFKSANTTRNDFDEKSRNLTKELTNRDIKINELTFENQQLKDSNRDELCEADKKSEEFVNRINTLMKENENYQSNVNSLESKIQTDSEEIEILNSDCCFQKKQVNKYFNKYVVQRKLIKQLQSELKVYQNNTPVKSYQSSIISDDNPQSSHSTSPPNNISTNEYDINYNNTSYPHTSTSNINSITPECTPETRKQTDIINLINNGDIVRVNIKEVKQNIYPQL